MTKSNLAKTFQDLHLPAPPSYSRQIKMIDGNPVVVVEENTLVPVKKAQLNQLMEQSLALPYDGEDARYAGLSKGAAIVIDLVDQASKGDPTARKEVLDRLMGKPVQNIKSLSVRASLDEFLDSIPGSDRAMFPQSEVDDL